MPTMGRLCGALAFPLALSAPAAEAQIRRSASVAPIGPGSTEAVPVPRGLPDFRMARDEYRLPPKPFRNGLTGSLPLGRDLAIAVGRLAVPNFAAPRMEAADIRRRDRAITAVGFSLRF